jgi:hypothetical protein
MLTEEISEFLSRFLKLTLIINLFTFFYEVTNNSKKLFITKEKM